MQLRVLGTYYLLAAGAPWYFSDRFARNEMTTAGSTPSSFVPTYFPSAPGLLGAAALVLHSGESLQADFILRRASGANVHFVCSSHPCGGAASLYALGPGERETLIANTEISGIEMPDQDVISTIPPGHCVVRYQGAGGSMRTVVDVGNGDLTVEIKPKPAPALSGQVIMQNAGERPERIFVDVRNEDTGQRLTASVDANGRFSPTNVVASRVRLFLSGDDRFFIAHMSVDGAIEKSGIINLENGTEVKVKIVISGETGGVQGCVVNEEVPVPGALVVLVPDPRVDSQRYLGVLTSSDGGYDFAHVPAGDYKLFSVDNPTLEYTNPTAVRPYLADAQQVRIKPHEALTERIPLKPSVRP